MNTFYFLDITIPFTEKIERHILEPLQDGGIRTFPYSDDNPNKERVDAWITEGNELTEWNPDAQPTEQTEPEVTEPAPEVVEEPVIEEETTTETEVL